jgi:hypothetical protein
MSITESMMEGSNSDDIGHPEISSFEEFEPCIYYSDEEALG